MNKLITCAMLVFFALCVIECEPKYQAKLKAEEAAHVTR